MNQASPTRHGRGGNRRRLGGRSSALEARRGELLALAYAIATFGAVVGWAADPRQVTSAIGLGVPVVLAGAAAAGFFLLRHRLPRHAEDVAIVASLGLLATGIAFTRQPALFAPYYIWVGFTAPIWFPLRRAVAYLLLAVVAYGIDAALAGTAVALAGWLVTVATLAIAFLVVLYLSRALVDQERLAAVGEMASAVGHELRNPLTSLMNTLFLLRSTIPAEAAPDLERHLGTAEREARRAASITEDLMAFVRPRRASISLVDLEETARWALGSTPPPATVRVETALESAAVLADPDQVVEILANLLSNAYASMPAGGTVRVGAGADRGAVLLVVEDDGEGMDEAVRARVFEPFFTTRARGTGLGLAIVQRLVEEQGGTIAVESAPGQGARFLVRLPRANTPE